MTRFLLVGNPESRRVKMFCDALREAGQPEPLVLPWLSLLRSPETLERVDEGPYCVRLDAYGQCFDVERELLVRGGYENAAELVERRGEVHAPGVSYRGFRIVLEHLKGVFARRKQWRVFNPPDEIDELFDKRRTARRLFEADIPVPDFLDDVPGEPGALLAALRERRWHQAFVKPAMGSSGSGVLQLSLTGSRAAIRTSLEWDEPRWFNNRRLSHYQTAEDVERALAFVLSQGAQVERAVPKAKLDGSFFDCRVLCIGGEPRFTVVRQNQHPITNLHLGAKRGDLERLRAAMPSGAWEAAMETCRKVAALYRSLHLGLDVLFEPGFKRHRVIEANAFGDLLPGLTLEGRSVYRWEIDEALRLQA